MKHQFVVKAHYPEAMVKHAYQDTKVIASDDAQAAKQALREFRGRDGIKRKHFNVVKLTISRSAIGAGQDESEGSLTHA
ncbi:MAG: hypothetical protein KJS98_09595 [Nitrospirae bacterium]|nr:hypothetical protein [Nitrospirota bacterium]MDE3038999.1 hypothetical protein [Nitrospirota bacterium]